jgi:hypothetical protein
MSGFTASFAGFYKQGSTALVAFMPSKLTSMHTTTKTITKTI